VLPQAVARWSLFDHKKVPSAVTFFCITLFYLSGAINSFLLVIARPQLLLLTRPKVDGQPERPLTPQTTGSTTVSDKERNLGSIAMVSLDVGPSKTNALKRVNSEISV
jgi:hypothetical protein